MATSTFCAFGQDCPHHNSCGCDNQWAHETSTLDWVIEIQHDGFLKFFFVNTNHDQFYICQRHFLSMLEFNEQYIHQMYQRWINGDSELRYKFRYEPEE